MIRESREADELILTMLAWRETGLGPTAIAAQMGITKNTVIGALHRIDRDDLDRQEAAE